MACLNTYFFTNLGMCIYLCDLWYSYILIQMYTHTKTDKNRTERLGLCCVFRHVHHMSQGAVYPIVTLARLWERVRERDGWGVEGDIPLR